MMLTLNKVVKSFEGVFQPVLRGIDWKLNTGDFCIIMGVNGSGKSTLLKTIAGEYKPDSGTIVFDYKDGPMRLSQVSQDMHKGTLGSLTLAENMVFAHMRKGGAKYAFYQRYYEQSKQAVKELGVGLEDLMDQPLEYLSGGQRQMVATLMAIESQPQILLLDEHTSALDPKMQVFLMNYTARAVRESHITTLMITHKIEDALRYGNRLIFLHAGTIVFDVQGAEKAKLSKAQLLDLFHKYADLDLMTGAQDEC